MKGIREVFSIWIARRRLIVSCVTLLFSGGFTVSNTRETKPLEMSNGKLLSMYISRSQGCMSNVYSESHETLHTPPPLLPTPVNLPPSLSPFKPSQISPSKNKTLLHPTTSSTPPPTRRNTPSPATSPFPKMPSHTRTSSSWSVQAFLDLRWISRLPQSSLHNSSNISAQKMSASLKNAREKKQCVERGDGRGMWNAVVCISLFRSLTKDGGIKRCG